MVFYCSPGDVLLGFDSFSNATWILCTCETSLALKFIRFVDPEPFLKLAAAEADLFFLLVATKSFFLGAKIELKCFEDNFCYSSNGLWM